MVYCGGLENRFGVTPNGGSNPSLSAGKNFVNNWTYIVIWALVVIAFGYLWWRGDVKRFANYCVATKVELLKCTWPTWDELKGSTLLISIMILLLGGFIVLVDRVLFTVFIH